jgi:hypothetical protein
MIPAGDNQEENLTVTAHSYKLHGQGAGLEKVKTNNLSSITRRGSDYRARFLLAVSTIALSNESVIDTTRARREANRIRNFHAVLTQGIPFLIHPDHLQKRRGHFIAVSVMA